MTIQDVVSKFSLVLDMANDISLKPNISSRKLANAIDKYGIATTRPDDILLLIDNTISGSGKQGMYITDDYLFAYSSISGRFSIKLDEIQSITPQVKKALAIPIIGITINEGYFISLPGLGQLLEDETSSTYALLLLTAFFVEALGCELLIDEDVEEEKSKPSRDISTRNEFTKERVTTMEYREPHLSNKSIRSCKKCGASFILTPFRERAGLSIMGNMALPGLGFFFGRKLKRYCPNCR